MKTFGPRLMVTALMLVIYGYFCGGYVNNVCTNAVADLTIAMVDDHSFQIDPYSGNSNDISTHDGHIFSGFGPGLSFMLVPVYVAIKPALALIPAQLLERTGQKLADGLYAKHGRLRSTNARMVVLLLIIAGTVCLSMPLGMLTTLYVVRTSRALFPSLSAGDFSLLIFATAFGTIIWNYSINLMHTGVAACLVWIAVARSMRTRSAASATETAWNGFLLALAPAVDYPAAIYVVCAGLFMLLISRPEARLKVAALLASGAALPVAALLGYHRSAFGSAFTNAYRFRMRAPDKGIFDVSSPSSSLPNAQKVGIAFFNSNCGLVLYFPLFLLGFVLAVYFLYTERDRIKKLFWGLTFAIMAANLGIYCSYPVALGPGGAPIFGVRYMMYSAPFVMVAFAALLARLPAHHAGRKALAGLALCNAIAPWAFALYGIPVFPQRGYWHLLTQVGPGTYTLTKLTEAKLLTTPIWAWLGACGIGALLFLWVRSVRRLIATRSGEVPTAPTSAIVHPASN